MAKQIRIVFGYGNSADVEELRNHLPEAEFKVVAYDSSAQRCFDNAIRLEADVVIVSPDCEGYRASLVQDLISHNRYWPFIVMGAVDKRSEEGRVMMNNGAAGFITTPIDSQGALNFMGVVRKAVEIRLDNVQTGRSSAQGDTRAESRGMSWKRQVITVFVPKGGGSHRTTTAVNLAAALSHRTLGNQPTMLLDFDQTKGDCHTMLGFITDTEAEIAGRRGMTFIDRGLFDMLENVGYRYGTQGVRGVDTPFINQFKLKINALPNSQLDLLPGLMRPTDSGQAIFQNRDMVLNVAVEIIRNARRNYDFTIIDIGQDLNQPLHQAALMEADDVLILVPPNITAVLDTRFALRALRQAFDGLAKFRLVITGYDMAFEMTEREIVDMLELPLAGVIPFEPLVANTAINRHTPYVLTDQGPLGNSMRELASIYLPSLKRTAKPRSGLAGTFGALKRIFVREK